jgi:alkylated DNA repair dioxygenase AlkB
MEPIYDKEYISKNKDVNSIFENLMTDLEWLKVTDARYEYFMSDVEISYTYGRGAGVRTYSSKPFHNIVREIMNELNADFGTSYDICFLNRYDNEKMWLGWHSDNSPEIDINHPIAVISFGAEREIWVKEKEFKGEIPENDKFLLNNGSLFVMPTGYQRTYLHKIPKWNKPCSTRISLTFRKYVKP